MPKDHVVSSAEPARQHSPNAFADLDRLPAAHYRFAWMSMMGDSWLKPQGGPCGAKLSRKSGASGVSRHRFPGLTLIPGPLLHVSVCMADYTGLPKWEPNREEKPPPLCDSHTHQLTHTGVNTHTHRSQIPSWRLACVRKETY